MSEIEPLDKLTRDLRKAARTLDVEEARYLVDQYYVLQDARIRADGQVRAMSEAKEPNEVLVWLGENAGKLEQNIKAALQKFVEGRRAGRWLLAQHGIGPVIAAGMLAHLDVYPWRCYEGPFSKTKKPCRDGKPHDNGECGYQKIHTAGAFWRFAGLDPTVKWEKGQKRPWNARLKVLAWKAGESFKKFSNADECYYGHLYRERKELEVGRNNEGLFKGQAEESLANKNWRRDTVTKAAYEAGKLPDGRLDLRATRYATKMFLSHLHWVMFEDKFGEKPPKPYVVEHLGHSKLMEPPHWPCE